MKKVFLFFLIIIIFSACGGTIKNVIFDKKARQEILFGQVEFDNFRQPHFEDWYNREYSEYEPDAKIISQLKSAGNHPGITIVLGTWCSDSRREVPRFKKILDLLNYPAEKVKIFAVNRDKKIEKEDISGLRIEFVPTFIFYSDGKETGRIVETPYKSLEADMLKIFRAE